MKLDRTELLKICETAKPALATRDLIPELLNYFFDGGTVTAYDGVLGIRVPFASELKGGLRGSILLGVLGNSRAKEVEVEFPDAGYALIRAGRTKLKLAMLPPERAVHELPKVGRVKSFRASAAFLDALKALLSGVGANSQVAEQVGVTGVVEKGALQLYATDSKTISWATVKDVKDWPLKAGERATLPTAFVEQLTKLADNKTELFLTVNEAVAVTSEGAKIFARLVDVPKPNDFRTIIDASMSGIQLVTIPSRLKLVLERAGVMLAGQTDEAVTIEIADDVLRLTADTPFGVLKDSIRLEEFPKAVSFRVNPELLKRGLPLCEHIGFSENATVMTGKDFVYLVANFGN